MLVFALTIQRSVDEFVFPFRPAPNDRELFFAQCVSLHQQPKVACGYSGFRNQHQATRLAIESIHD